VLCHETFNPPEMPTAPEMKKPTLH